jgi:hypothetical protein
MVACQDVENCEDNSFLTRTPSQRRKAMKKLSIFDVKELLSFCTQAKIHEQHVYRIWRAIVNNGAKNIDTIPDIPKVLKDFVTENCSFQTITVTETLNSHGIFQFLFTGPLNDSVSSCLDKKLKALLFYCRWFHNEITFNII